MKQSQASTQSSQIVVGSLPADILLSGSVVVFRSPSRSTLQPLSGSECISAPAGTAKPLSNLELTSAIREVEKVWRERIKVQKEAKPVSYKAMVNAQEFLTNLALHFSLEPEVSSFPDGEISLEWNTNRGSLSVLVDERNIYFYSKTRSGKRRKGAESWDSTIPREILASLEFLIAA